MHPLQIHSVINTLKYVTQILCWLLFRIYLKNFLIIYLGIELNCLTIREGYIICKKLIRSLPLSQMIIIVTRWRYILFIYCSACCLLNRISLSAYTRKRFVYTVHNNSHSYKYCSCLKLDKQSKMQELHTMHVYSASVEVYTSCKCIVCRYHFNNCNTVFALAIKSLYV